MLLEILKNWIYDKKSAISDFLSKFEKREDVICTNSFHFLCHIECFSDILIIISLKEEFDSKGHLIDLLVAKKLFFSLNTMRWWLSLWRFTVRWWDGSHETFLGGCTTHSWLKSASKPLKFQMFRGALFYSRVRTYKLCKDSWKAPRQYKKCTKFLCIFKQNELMTVLLLLTIVLCRDAKDF